MSVTIEQFINIIATLCEAHAEIPLFDIGLMGLNPVDSADYAQRMSGVISKKTLLEGLPIVTDVERELQRLREENESDE